MLDKSIPIGYKQTKVGIIPNDWEVKKIKGIGKVNTGLTPLRSNNEFFKNGNIKWVKTTDLNNGLITDTEESITKNAIEETSIKIFPKETILIAMYGGFNQIGRTGVLGISATTNQAISSVVLDKKSLAKYILYFLNYRRFYWKRYASSSRKDPNITKNDVESFPILFPPLHEQEKIAEILTTWDDAIYKTTKLIDEHKTYKKGLMQQLFSAKIETDADGNATFTPPSLRFAADDGSSFPDWQEKKLGDLGEIITGKTPSTNNKSLWGEEIDFITPTDLEDENRFYIKVQRKLSNKVSYKILPKGTIIYTCIASIGKIGITNNNSSTTNQQINSIIVNKYYHNLYVYYSLLEKTGRIQSKQANTTLPIINKKDFSRIKILLPSIVEQQKNS